MTLAKERFDGKRFESPSRDGGEPIERSTVASNPANTTTAVFRGTGGRDPHQQGIRGGSGIRSTR